MRFSSQSVSMPPMGLQELFGTLEIHLQQVEKHNRNLRRKRTGNLVDSGYCQHIGTINVQESLVFICLNSGVRTAEETSSSRAMMTAFFFFFFFLRRQVRLLGCTCVSKAESDTRSGVR